ncbi:hypothetical protein ABPG72_001677 [Tetrahymena utriculariae]
MFYNNQYSSFSNQQIGFPQYQGFQTHSQQQQQHPSLLNGFVPQQQQQQYGNNQLFAPNPINNFSYSAQNQFVKSSSPMQLNHASFTSNNQDQYSENSTSCGSEENQQDDFLDQMPQLQPTLSFKNIQATSPAITLNSQQQHNSNNIQKIAPKIATASVPATNTSSAASTNVIPEEAKYKTEMCKNWVENGKCNYGDKCKFAHGKNELVQKVAANKHFKTKKCKQYYESCVCNYGPRCHFVHDIRTVAEIKANNEYTKKMIHPEIFLDLSSLPSQTSISSNQPSASRRLDIFQKLTSSQTSFISNTTSQ